MSLTRLRTWSRSSRSVATSAAAPSPSTSFLRSAAHFVAERAVLGREPGPFAAHLLDQRDELADFVFEAFDGVDFDALGGLGHGGS